MVFLDSHLVQILLASDYAQEFTLVARIELSTPSVRAAAIMATFAPILIEDHEIIHVLVSLIVVLGVANLVGYLFSRIFLPKVVGEIVGGLLLGPNLFGSYFPQAYQWMFRSFPEQGIILAAFSWMGMIFLMFAAGLEVFYEREQKSRQEIVHLTFWSTALPVLVGVAVYGYAKLADDQGFLLPLNEMLGPAGNRLSLILVITITLAITSIPVLSRIVHDLGIQNTRFAGLVLGVATLQDMGLWLLLALATGMVGAQHQMGHLVGISLGSLFIFWLALRHGPLLLWFIDQSPLRLLIQANSIASAILFCLFLSFLTGIIGINIIFGAFLAGIILQNRSSDRVNSVLTGVKSLSRDFLTPFYFGVVGLNLNFQNNFDFKLCAIYVGVAVLVKGIGSLIGSKLAGYDTLSRVNLAIALSTRGGPCIIVATVSYTHGIISQSFYNTLIILSIVTAIFAGAWLKWICDRGFELLNKESEPSEAGSFAIDLPRYRDRETATIVTEKVFGDGLLSRLYPAKKSSFLAKTFAAVCAPLFTNKWFSKWYGFLQSQPVSAHKIPDFVARFGVDLRGYLPEGQDPKIFWPNFNAFFTRKYLPGKRPFEMNPEVLPIPAEGKVAAYPHHHPLHQYQIKGHRLRLPDLLSQSPWLRRFEGGSLLVIRLSPNDYHRVHYPDDGTVLERWTISGPLHSVGKKAIECKDNILFTNERQVEIMHSAHFGVIAMIEVGALAVGRIKSLTSIGQKVQRGDEKSYFEFGGSTVLILFEPNMVMFDKDLVNYSQEGFETFVKLGSAIGTKFLKDC